jgi:transcriptional regulator with XRE-family HTH domain
LCQRELADEIGVCATTIRNWELGRYRPPVRLVPRLIAFLGYCPWKAPAHAGERLRVVREALGLTQGETAARLGIDPGTLSRWESGACRLVAGYRHVLVRVAGR